MPYSALIFETKTDIPEGYQKVKELIDVFNADVNCAQIVVSCPDALLLELVKEPGLKTTYVPFAKSAYVALLNGLKAVSQDNVLVCGLSDSVTSYDIQEILDVLSTYPAVYATQDLQAFDTRLLMFCLQRAIEINIAIDNYADAIEKLSDLPIKYM